MSNKVFDTKRSNEPPVWLLFSAGGMVSALFFPILIFVLGMFLALLLPISTKRNRRYNELLKWVVYAGFVWRAAIAFLPSLLKLFGYTRNSFEGTLSGNPPAVYYTEINQ